MTMAGALPSRSNPLELFLMFFFRSSRASIRLLMSISIPHDLTFIIRKTYSANFMLLPVTLSQGITLFLRKIGPVRLLLLSLRCHLTFIFLLSMSRSLPLSFTFIICMASTTYLLLQSVSLSLQQKPGFLFSNLSRANTFSFGVSLSGTFSLRGCHICPSGSCTLCIAHYRR
ncbi:hypothetical protein JG687_00013855 [Phytophthora cactorum]|nr:hypothetical protein JG687_00013855 [Phytophthora cactorum]